MKLKATRKKITDNFAKIYLIDYKYGFLPDAFAYNSGYLGWNWNAYDLGGICLIDGNRNFPKCKLLPKSAQKIVDEYKKEIINAKFEDQQKINEKYLNKFIKVLLND